MPHGLPLVGGGFIGFLCKKLIKLAIIGLGLIFVLIAYLEYQKWIIVDWSTVQTQTSAFIQTSAQKTLDVINNTAQDLAHNNLNHIDAVYPILGVVGFVPGFILGLTRG